MAKKIEKDLTVIGGGLAGMCVAIAAARRGVSVALINDRSVLGGNASSEIGVAICGSSHHGLSPTIYAKEGGLIEEIRQRLLYAATNQGYNKDGAKDAVFFEMILNEPNIELFLNTSAINVIVKDSVINSVVAYNTKSETEFEFISSQYADCSGDGIVGYKAGASFMMGSESKSQFGEKWATENEEAYTMGNSLYWEIEDTGRPVSYVAPSFAKDITKLKNFDELQNKLKFRNLSVNGVFWTLEYGGQKNTIKDSEEIASELRALVYGIWGYIKNSGQFPQAKNYTMKYGYVNLNINVKTGRDKKIYLVFRKNKNISICCSNTRIPGAVTFRYYDSTNSMGEYWDNDSLGFNHDSIPFDGVNKEVYPNGIINFVRDTSFEGEDIGYLAFDQVSHQICFKDISPNQNVYSEENLLNEYSRPYGRLNMWISDSVGARITLESNGLRKIKELQLIFDTNLETDVIKRMPEQLVKDYDITFITAKGEKVINIRDNIQRMNKIKVDLEDVSKVKIEILKTYGASKAHLYGIRVLGDDRKSDS